MFETYGPGALYSRLDLFSLPGECISSVCIVLVVLVGKSEISSLYVGFRSAMVSHLRRTALEAGVRERFCLFSGGDTRVFSCPNQTI